MFFSVPKTKEICTRDEMRNFLRDHGQLYIDDNRMKIFETEDLNEEATRT